MFKAVALNIIFRAVAQKGGTSMYNKTRKELIKEICDRLNLKGFKDFSNYVG